MKELIADYLAQGYKPVAIAGMAGCSEAYISELFNTDEGFRELLRGKMKEHTAVRLSNKYDRLEESTLKGLEESIANCDVNDMVRILEGIARIKNANKSVIPPGHHNNPTVGLTLIFPQQNIPKLVTDDSNRVIAIGEKTMLPMPAKAVRDIFKEKMDLEAAAKEIRNDLKIEKQAHG